MLRQSLPYAQPQDAQHDVKDSALNPEFVPHTDRRQRKSTLRTANSLSMTLIVLR